MYGKKHAEPSLFGPILTFIGVKLCNEPLIHIRQEDNVQE